MIEYKDWAIAIYGGTLTTFFILQVGILGLIAPLALATVLLWKDKP